MFSFWTLTTRGLNGALFVLIGIEAHSATRAVPAGAISALLLFCVLAWVVILVIRFGFQMITTWMIRLLDRRPSQRGRRMSHRARVVSTVAGFRGAVSLAVALAVPAGVGGRNEIIFVATGVVILTLVVQGMLLPVAIGWARFEPDTHMDGELAEAHRETTLAALHAIPALAEREQVPDPVRDRIADEYRERLDRMSATATGELHDAHARLAAADEAHAAMRLALLEHKRGVLIRLRDEHTISDTTLRILQARLDRDALRLAPPKPAE